VGVKVAYDKGGNKGIELGGEDVWECMASAFTRDLVVNVYDMEDFFSGGNVEDHGGGGGHWVVKVVYN
jgi:hypothetical protein